MNDRDALLAAILANPDEDTPRLMFADWLDENGDADRAEFVRVQCELARLRAAEVDLPEATRTSYPRQDDWPVAWHPDGYEYRRGRLTRERELLTAHSDEWREGLPQYADNATNRRDVQFRRGFVGDVTVPLGRLTKAPAELWQRHPVEAILLHYSGGNDRRKIPKCAPLAALRELCFLDNNGDDDTLTPYAECPHLSGLRKLALGLVALTDGGAKALARSPHLRPAVLELDGRALSASGLAALLNGPFASRLRAFRPKLAVGGAEVVAGAPLRELRRLELQLCGLGDAEIETLTRSAHLTQLVTLNLTANQLTDAALATLAAWPGLASVRVLNLGNNRVITGHGLSTLLESPHLRPIYLGLEWTNIGDDGARALAMWPGLTNLVGLDLGITGIGEVGATVLARSPHWGEIRFLKMWSGGRIGQNVLDFLRTRVSWKADVWG